MAPERRCSPYDPKDYRYPRSLETQLVAEMGRIYGPYTGRCFKSPTESDIEHIVARSEAHDSGLCAASASTRRAFASDPLNLTLASPWVNRVEKHDHDAAAWMPDQNRCWFAARVVDVRRKYCLTIDRREADELERVLSECTSTAMVISECDAEAATSAGQGAAIAGSDEPEAEALRDWDDDGNGKITCAEAVRHQIAPVRRGHPAYRFMLDRDSDGIVCE